MLSLSSSGAATRVLVDDQVFLEHSRSGISRYFAELIGEFRVDPSHGVEAITPYRWVANEHLADANPHAYRRVRMGPLRSHRPPLLRAANRMRFRERPVDLVHHTNYSHSALATRPGVPRVATVYDAIPELFPMLFPGWEELAADKARFLARADGLVCISETTRRDLVRLHGDPGVPLVVAPLAAAGHFHLPLRQPVRPLPDRYLLYVGARRWHKNTDLLLSAFADVAPRHPDLHLLLVGGGPVTATERELLGAAGVAVRVLQRDVSDTELPWVYANAVALVHPSRYEGFGLPLVEAFSVGCPVLASDTPCLHEVAADAAWFFAPDDRQCLTDLLDRVVDDSAARSELATAGHRRGDDFSWARTAKLTADLYRTVIGARP
jgi:glycosyltransferase involved in cell wall biosynthesis